MDVVEVGEVSSSGLLDHVADLAATQRRCEVEILKTAVQHAYLHDRDSLGPAESGKPPFPGIYHWRDPDGAFYLVDHTGSRALREAA